MRYAKVVVGLPVEGPFDYIIPPAFKNKIKVGARVKVDFAYRKLIGYVVGLSDESKIKKLKPLTGLIDAEPLLNKNILFLAEELAKYYCCSLGQAIETALPEPLRKGRKIEACSFTQAQKNKGRQEVILLHDLDGNARWEVYLREIKEAQNAHRSVIVILPDVGSLYKINDLIAQNLSISCDLLYRKQPQEWLAWSKIRTKEFCLVVGTRSSVFAPVNNLGLIILDEEEDPVYKQDQVPHYHAREAAFMRTKNEGAKLILGSSSPSLESMYLVKCAKISYQQLERKSPYPQVTILDLKQVPFRLKKGAFLHKALQDALYAAWQAKNKSLLFINRKGFATFAFCHNCKESLKCPRCNISLVYHASPGRLSCHYCNFKMELPEICPSCKAGYIKFSGFGTEKIENELARIFPQAKIMRFDTFGDKPQGLSLGTQSRSAEGGKKPGLVALSVNTEDTHKANIKKTSPDACHRGIRSVDNGHKLIDAGQDIYVATSAIIRQAGFNFDLTAVLSVDNSLNRVDLRAAERTYALLCALLKITKGNFIVQTSLASHHCLTALNKRDPRLFYDQELKQRKQLGLVPWRHIILVKLRARAQEKAKQRADALFTVLKANNKNKGIKILSVNPAALAKLRGNFYWQILISTHNVYQATRFLKIYLKDFSHSGIIVTVDVDPV